MSEPGQEVIEERENSHGDYLRQSRLAQAMKMAFHSQPGWERLSAPQRESLDMIAVKISRILSGDPNEVDHWRDLSGYATLIVNLLTKGTHL